MRTAIYTFPMEFTVGDVPVHYAEYGSGTAVVALHGAGVDHREIAGALEPMFSELPGYRRLYPDLPGMGRTPAPMSIASNEDVVQVVLGFIDGVIGTEPFLIIGQSYGGYLARAIANRRPGQVIGMALVCPVGEPTDDVPAHRMLVSTGLPATLDADLEAGYRDYFVVQTAETLRRYQEYVFPSRALVDEKSLMRIFSRWQFRERPEAISAYPHPTLILLGRQDATAGFTSQWQLLEHYPRATFAVLDRAGHALLHEQPELARRLVGEWLFRVGEHA
jgi:pimeloyl-ACP methyl ester carboxylesterase